MSLNKMLVPLLMSALLAQGCGGSSTKTATAGHNRPDPKPIVVNGRNANFTTMNTATGIERSLEGGCSAPQQIGEAEDSGMTLVNASWLQVVNQNALDNQALLASNKALKLRVDVVASKDNVPMPKGMAYIFDSATGECMTRELTSSAIYAPRKVNPMVLTESLILDLPAALVKPGLSVVVTLDGERVLTRTEADRVFMGAKPTVANPWQETVIIVPIAFGDQVGSATPEQVRTLMQRTLPQADIEVSTVTPIRPAEFNEKNTERASSGHFRGTYAQMSSLLNQLDDLCRTYAGARTSAITAPKCYGAIPSNLIFSSSPGSQIVGLAYTGGIAMLSQQLNSIDIPSITNAYQQRHWLSLEATTFTHEMGHLMNLGHGACGGTPETDGRLYADGRLGTGGGYDSGRDFYFSSALPSSENVRTDFSDVMSYCGKGWMSDLGYKATLQYRAPQQRQVAARSIESEDQAPKATEWLKVTHHLDGRWSVKPVAFAPTELVDTLLTLKLADGQTLPLLAPDLDMPDGEQHRTFWVQLSGLTAPILNDIQILNKLL